MEKTRVIILTLRKRNYILNKRLYKHNFSHNNYLLFYVDMFKIIQNKVLTYIISKCFQKHN